MQKLGSFLKCNTSITKYIHYVQGVKKLIRLLSLLNLAYGTADRTHIHTQMMSWIFPQKSKSKYLQKCPNYFEHTIGLSN